MNIKGKKFILSMFTFFVITLFGTSVNAQSVANVSNIYEFKDAVLNSATEINVVCDIDITGIGILNVSDTIVNLNGNKILADNFTAIFEGTNFTIKNGSFDAKGGSYGLFIGENTTDNVLIENISINGGINVFNSTNVVLRNVNISVTEGSNKYYAIWCDENAHVTVESGYFTSTGVAVIGMSMTETSLDIEDGTFITNNNPLVLQGNFNKPTIKGGIFNVPVLQDYYPNGYELVMIGNSYSVCNHLNTIIKNEINPTCTTDGYTGDTCCSKCDKLIKNGNSIQALGHNFAKWEHDKNNHFKVCINNKCDEIMPDSIEAHKFNDNYKCEICDYEDVDKILEGNENKLEHKLDNEPKTGSSNITIFAGIIATISLSGYMICKKNLCK